MSRIFWDSNLFIYLIEDHGTFNQLVVRLAQRMFARDDVLLASTLTLGEVLVHPKSVGNESLCQKYEEVISRRALLLSFDRETAGIYASIRATRTVKAPDAIQLACAVQGSADMFVTNDDRLSQSTIPGISFITSLQTAAQVL